MGCVCFASLDDAFAAPPANPPPAAALQGDTGEDFIELTVGCPCGDPDMVSIFAGVQDNFDLGNGPEPASPSPELLTFMLTFCSAIQPLFDLPNVNTCFGHTLTDLPSCVIGASVTIGLRGDSGGVFNDVLALEFLGPGGPPYFAWGLPIANLPGTGGKWMPGQTVVVTLDLADLPPDGNGVTNILIGLEDGDLDVFVQDDTSVDFITLDLIFCESACPGDLIGDLNNDGSVGVPDILILLAFWGPCGPVCLRDLDGDGNVGVSDLLILLANWGGPCP